MGNENSSSVVIKRGHKNKGVKSGAAKKCNSLSLPTFFAAMEERHLFPPFPSFPPLQKLRETMKRGRGKKIFAFLFLRFFSVGAISRLAPGKKDVFL